MIFRQHTHTETHTRAAGDKKVTFNVTFQRRDPDASLRESPLFLSLSLSLSLAAAPFQPTLDKPCALLHIASQRVKIREQRSSHTHTHTHSLYLSHTQAQTMIRSATTTTTTKRHTKTHTQAAHSVAPPSPDALEINAASVTNEMHNLPSSRSSTRRRLGPDGAHTVNHNHHNNNKNSVKLRRLIYRQGDALLSTGFKWSLYCWETIWAKSRNKTFLPLFSLLSSSLLSSIYRSGSSATPGIKQHFSVFMVLSLRPLTGLLRGESPRV